MSSVIWDAVNYLWCLQLLPQKRGGLLCLPYLPPLGRSPGHHKHHRKPVLRKLSATPGSCSWDEVNCSTGMNDCIICHRSINSWIMPTCTDCSSDILVLSWIPATSFPFFWNKHVIPRKARKIQGCIPSNAKRRKYYFLLCFLTYVVTDLFPAATFEDWTAYFPFADVMYREYSPSFQPAVPIIVNQAWKSIIIWGASKTVDKNVIFMCFYTARQSVLSLCPEEQL